jgi:ABC-type uncharacterized transport system permease subunit
MAEQTSKKWKFQIFLSAVILLTGIFVIAAVETRSSPDDPHMFGYVVFGVGLIAIGLVWQFYAQAMAWWHHG